MKTISKADDVYIALLRFGKINLTNGVGFRDAYEFLKDEDHEFDEALLKILFFDSFTETRNFGNDMTGMIANNVPHVLTMEGYSRLLEHDELMEARASSSDAKRLGRRALAVSAVLAFASILIALIQFVFN